MINYGKELSAHYKGHEDAGDRQQQARVHGLLFRKEPIQKAYGHRSMQATDCIETQACCFSTSYVLPVAAQ